MSYGTYRVCASVTVVQVVVSYTVSIFCRSEAGSRSDAPTIRQPAPSPATLALAKMCEKLGGRATCVVVGGCVSVAVLSPSCGELEGTGASPCAGKLITSLHTIRPKPSRKPRLPVSKVAHRKERMCCHWERAAVCEQHVHTMAWHGLSRVHTTRCASHRRVCALPVRPRGTPAAVPRTSRPSVAFAARCPSAAWRFSGSGDIQRKQSILHRCCSRRERRPKERWIPWRSPVGLPLLINP